MGNASAWPFDCSGWIARALLSEDGHLFIGEAGCTLQYRRGARLCGCDADCLKAACVAAGLPVVDSRGLSIEAALWLADEDSQRVMPGDLPDALPWYGWTYGPLHTVAALYHAAGAEVVNLPEVTGTGGGTAP